MKYGVTDAIGISETASASERTSSSMKSEQLTLSLQDSPARTSASAKRGAALKESGGGRSGLWSQACRIIRELEPRYAIIENVPALLGRGLEQVVQDLDAIGYDAEWNCISAAWAGGEQARDRVWIVANAKGERVEGLWSQRIEVARPLAQPFLPVRRGDGQWEVEPDLRRSAYGVSTRLDGRVNSWGDRLKQCGNAVCPQIAEMIGRAILSAA